jgi:hypothetical protein
MLLGGVAYASKQRRRQEGVINALTKAASTQSAGSLSIQGAFGLIKNLHEHGGTVVAVGTTAASIYTGLKGIIGS